MMWGKKREGAYVLATIVCVCKPRMSMSRFRKVGKRRQDWASFDLFLAVGYIATILYVHIVAVGYTTTLLRYTTT